MGYTKKQTKNIVELTLSMRFFMITKNNEKIKEVALPVFFLRIFVFSLFFLVLIDLLSMLAGQFFIHHYLVKFGSLTCHQIHEKCISLNGMYSFVCSRCIGVYVGSFIGIFLFKRFDLFNRLNTIFISFTVLLIAFLLSQWGINDHMILRLISGIIGGIGIYFILEIIIQNMVNKKFLSIISN